MQAPSSKRDPPIAPAAHHPCRKKKRAKGGAGAYWSNLQGWKSVDIGDEFLLGAEEGGFAGLEVLEDATVLDAGARARACGGGGGAGVRGTLRGPMPLLHAIPPLTPTFFCPAQTC